MEGGRTMNQKWLTRTELHAKETQLNHIRRLRSWYLHLLSPTPTPTIGKCAPYFRGVENGRRIDPREEGRQATIKKNRGLKKGASPGGWRRRPARMQKAGFASLSSSSLRASRVWSQVCKKDGGCIPRGSSDGALADS